MVKRNSAANDDLRQAQLSKKLAQAKAKKLLANAKLDIREYRKELSTLKKAGLVSKRIHAGRHKPTRYMISKINAFKPIALGHEIAIPIKKMSPHRLREYVENGLASVRKFGKQQVVTRPRTHEKQRIDVHKGHIRVITQLERGQEEIIPLGTRLNDITDVYRWLEMNADRLNELGGSRAQFGFQIFGHNSRRGFPNVQELIKYLQLYNGATYDFNYQRGDIQDKRLDYIEFVLIKFRPGRKSNRPQMEPYLGEKRYSRKSGELRGREKELSRKYRMETNRQRQYRKRLDETKEEKEARLAKQREYDRARANERREKRMAKKLLGE